MSWTWDIKRKILVNNAVKQEGIVSCAVLGKKDWKHQNDAAPKRWADAQSHSLRKKDCSAALSARHNDVCLGSVPLVSKDKKGDRVGYVSIKANIILYYSSRLFTTSQSTGKWFGWSACRKKSCNTWRFFQKTILVRKRETLVHVLKS